MKRALCLVALFALWSCGDADRRPGTAHGGSGGIDGSGGSGGAAGGSGGSGGGPGGSGGTETPGCTPDEVEIAGVCRERCDPRDGAGCAEGTSCVFLGADSYEEPWGACLPPQGPGVRGAACGSDAPCGAGFVCVDQAGGGRCAPVCTWGAEPDGCGEGQRCAPLGRDRVFGICEPARCTADRDCADDQVCAVWIRPSDGGVDGACIFPVGQGPAGSPCDADDECASGACVEELGICHGICATGADCEGGSCHLYGHAQGNQSVWLPTCLRDCDDDASCGPDQACVFYDTRETDLNTVCVPAVGEVEAGGPCTDNDQCRSGLCNVFHPGSTGICEGGCTDHDDCAEETECVATTRDSAGDDGVWGTADDREVHKRCRGLTCTSSADCPGDQACAASPEDVGGVETLVFRCTPPAGTAVAGDPCWTMCATGACAPPPHAPPEDCWDGVDNDGDGAVDCDDPSCGPWCPREICDDGIDGDGDGAIDCADLDCEAFCTTEQCANGADDDGDGLADCDDPDCYFDCHEVSACGDYADEDGDGLIDCDDPDCCLLDWEDVCRGKRACGESFCFDGMDDDLDGFVDCADRDCFDRPGCIETDCFNGVDDDGDGLVDCADRWDCAAHCRERSCDDGVDDDLDLLVDCFDDDCAESPSCRESLCAAGDCCTNGLDDDGDGRIDCQDGDCASGPACAETGCGGDGCCSNGRDDDGNDLIDCADPACRQDAACDEGALYAWGSCSDGIDQDGDGLVDCADPDCGFDWLCSVCFEPCEEDADCPGGRCVEGAAAIEEPPYGGNFRYVKACVPDEAARALRPDRRGG